MRFSVPVLMTALILSSSMAIGPAAAFGLSFDFPTLTWPVSIPAPTPAQPAVDCTAGATPDPFLCPAPSR